jgi:hypothetical protein
MTASMTSQSAFEKRAPQRESGGFPPPPTPVGKRLIVVLGMHRSGTSATTRALKVFGVHLGDELIPAIAGNNDKGFYEDIDLNALDMRMLDAIGSDWHNLTPIGSEDVQNLRNLGFFLEAVDLLRRKTAHHRVFGFKDPRVAKLLPFWTQVFSHCQYDVSYLLVLRNPLAVAKSLERREGFNHEKSYLLWLGHVITSLLLTKDQRRVLVDFDLLFKAPAETLTTIGEGLSLDIDSQAQKEYLSEFLDHELRHNIFSVDDLTVDKACPPLVRDVYTTLLKYASEASQIDAPALHEITSRWAEEFDREKPHLQWIDRLLQQIAALQRSTDAQNAEKINLINIANEQLASARAELSAATLDFEARQRQAERDFFAQSTALKDELIRAARASEMREREFGSQLMEITLRAAQVTRDLADRDAQLMQVDRDLAARNLHVAKLAGQLGAISRTVSWRMTWPMRKLAEWFGSKPVRAEIESSGWQALGELPPRIGHAESEEPDGKRVTDKIQITQTDVMFQSEIPVSAANSLAELLQYQAIEFVICAYRTLLRRDPDAQGRQYYLARMLEGSPKIQILDELSKSEEARNAGAHLPGLARSVRWYRLAQIPVLRILFGLFVDVEVNSVSQSRLRAIEQRLYMDSRILRGHFFGAVPELK